MLITLPCSYGKEPLDALDRTSEHYRRATRAGWTFSPLTKAVLHGTGANPGRVFIYGKFTCTCGREETYQIETPMSSTINVLENFIFSSLMQRDKIDMAFILYMNGSFSVDHLIADGYSEEAVREIQEKYWAPLESASLTVTG